MEDHLRNKTERSQSKSLTPRDKAFLNQIKDAIEANLSDENFGVNELANEMAISRFQILRKLRPLTGKNISQFIRETRLEKAMEYLKNDIGTVSEIAYKVGFSSPTYFNTCFRKYYGTTPGEIRLSEDVLDDSIEKVEERSDEKDEYKKKNKFSNLIIFSAVCFIVIGLVAAFLIANKYHSKPQLSIAEKSIAVLYFDNLSNDEENQYFADGVVESIISNLSTIEKLRVSPRTSTDPYKDSDQPIQEIGRELEVSYIMTGSVQKYNNQVRITTNIIDIAKDKNIWSRQYTQPLNDIFNIMNRVAIDVTSELKVNLNPEEEKNMARIHTINFSAFDLYLRGKKYYENFLIEYANKDLIRAENFYKEALMIDSTFALAYVGLGEIHKSKSKWGATSSKYIYEHADSMKMYANKAIRYDPDLAMAYVLTGDYFRFHHFADSAIKYLNKAISLQNNLVESHISLAQILFEEKGDVVQAFQYIKKAQYYERNGVLLPEIIFTLGSFYLGVEDYQNAEELIIYHRKISPEIIQLNGPLAWLNVVRGKFEKSNSILDSVYNSVKGSNIANELNWYYGWKSMLYSMMQKYDSAIYFYQQKQGFHIDFVELDTVGVDVNLLYAYFKTGHKKEWKQYSKYLMEKKIKSSSNPDFELAELYAASGEYEKSISVLLQLEKQNPYSNVFTFLPHFHLYEGMWDMPEFKALIKRVKEKKALARERIRELEKQYEQGISPNFVS